MRRTIFVLALLIFAPTTYAGECSALLQHEMRKLHSDEKIDLCERYGGKAVLVVNTASFCGYTGQFKQLEALYQEYKAQGLTIAGFPSNDFRQEAGEESKTAEVCFVNYGVTFDMFSPIRVKGDDAHPLFQSLAKESSPPQWNFTKYLVDRNGQVVQRFDTATNPDDKQVRDAIEAAL